MGNRVRINFNEMKNWIYSHKDDPSFFKTDQTFPYIYISDTTGQPINDYSTYKFRYFSQYKNRYGDLIKEDIYLQLIDDNKIILLITPKTQNSFIWGNHYNISFKSNYGRPWREFKNIFDLHFTSYMSNINQRFQITRKMYQFRDNQLCNTTINRKITDEAFARIPLIYYNTSPMTKMNQVMTDLNERQLIRDIFDVIHNQQNYQLPYSGGKIIKSSKKIFFNKKGKKSYMENVYPPNGGNRVILNINKFLIIKIWNKKTNLWNYTVCIYNTDEMIIKIFGIKSISDQFSFEKLSNFITLALNSKKRKNIFDM